MRIDPRHATITAWVAGAISGAIVLVVAILAAVVDPQARPILLTLVATVIIGGGFTTVMTFLHGRSIRYALRTHDMVVHKGVLFFSETIQPLRRVQHVELKRGPIDKRYGLAALKLFSAGLGKETFVLPGLALEDAERVRSHVLGYGE